MQGKVKKLFKKERTGYMKDQVIEQMLTDIDNKYIAEVIENGEKQKGGISL